MRRAVAVLLALCVGLIGPSAARVSLASVALSQESLVPPELGDVVLADPLTATGPLRAAGCATGRNRTDFISEGFRQKVTGRCSESSTVAGIRTTVNGLSIADGEIATEAQVLEGAERARASSSTVAYRRTKRSISRGSQRVGGSSCAKRLPQRLCCW